MILGKPFFLKTHFITLLGTSSNAFSKSTKYIYILLYFTQCSSCNFCTKNNLVIVSFASMKPNCASLKSNNARILLSNTLLISSWHAPTTSLVCRTTAHHNYFSLKNWHHSTNFPFIWDSLSIQNSLAKLHHHFLCNPATCNNHLLCYFRVLQPFYVEKKILILPLITITLTTQIFNYQEKILKHNIIFQTTSFQMISNLRCPFMKTWL